MNKACFLKCRSDSIRNNYIININDIIYIMGSNNPVYSNIIQTVIWPISGISESYSNLKSQIKKYSKLLKNKEFIEIPVYLSSFNNIDELEQTYLYIDINKIVECKINRDNGFMHNETVYVEYTIYYTDRGDNFSFYQTPKNMQNIFFNNT